VYRPAFALLPALLLASCPTRITEGGKKSANGTGNKTYECKSEQGCTVTVGGGKASRRSPAALA
jgi:hypothetical protein